jgi:competence protein ComEC
VALVAWGKERGRAGTWPEAGEERGRVWTWPGTAADVLRDFAARVRLWIIADTGPGRLLPWLPVAFGLGIAIYFTAEREPIWWVGCGLAAVLAIITFFARTSPAGFPLALVATSMAAGLAAATLKTFLIAHPVLLSPVSNVDIAGFVEVREERDRSDRIVVRALKLDAPRIQQKPDRVRVSVKKGTAPPVGSYVTFRARLTPPLAPLRPGGYDFARDLYFQRIGAVGFVQGAIKITDPPFERGLWLKYAATIQGLRDGIDTRIRAVVPGDNGAIASALITGKRDAISTSVNDAMYISSLAHILSISGYHMAVVAGVVFFVLRALLALIPGLASHRPIKKWSALAALLAAFFYLLLSGAEVATQRAFIMTAIVLIGVMADRPALTLRTLAIAAFAVLIIAPQSVVHPSFQMSFAATLALVAAYERGLPWMATANTSAAARVALWGGREIVGLLLASVVAGLATMPYAAFHFHRLAPYGTLANLLAMPIVSAWVMPSGLLALIAIPFGFDGPLWRLMGEGIGWMVHVALWVASLPGAVGRIPAFGIGALLLGTGGLVVLCLLRTPMRWAGAGLILLASVWAVRAPQPDVLIADGAQTVGVRGGDGRLSIHKIGNDAFAVREWLAADGDARLPTDPTLKDKFVCDDAGCIARAADGRLVAFALSAEALAEDCGRVSLIVTPRDGPMSCAATVVDRKLSRTSGAIALTRSGDGWIFEAARPSGQDRPWAKAISPPGDSPTPAPNTRTAPRDATPRAEDLEAGDQ